MGSRFLYPPSCTVHLNQRELQGKRTMECTTVHCGEDFTSKGEHRAGEHSVCQGGIP